jgi:hypothetical protein
LRTGGKDEGNASKGQVIFRGRFKAFFISIPLGIAEAIDLKKRNFMKWKVKDKNYLILKGEWQKY